MAETKDTGSEATGIFNLESTSAGRALIVFGEVSNFYTSVAASSMILGGITGNAPTFTSILADCGEEVVAESVTEIVYGVTGERNIVTEFASSMFVSGLRGKVSSGMKNTNGIDGSYVSQKIDVDNFDVPTGSNVTQGINSDVDLQYHSSYDNIDDVDVSNELYNVDHTNANVIDSIDVEEVVQESVEGGIKTNFDNEIPRSGDEWHNYFNEKYGSDNVIWESASIDDIIDMPSNIVDFSPSQVADLARNSGWSVEPLGKGGLAGVPFEQGGGLSMHAPNGSSLYIQYHPGGGHHGSMPYFKVSSGQNGTVRYYINGERAN